MKATDLVKAPTVLVKEIVLVKQFGETVTGLARVANVLAREIDREKETGRVKVLIALAKALPVKAALVKAALVKALLVKATDLEPLTRETPSYESCDRTWKNCERRWKRFAPCCGDWRNAARNAKPNA